MRRRHWHRPERPALLAAVTVALVVAVGIGGWAVTRPAPQAPTPSTVAATTGTMSQTVTATGTIQPDQQADLSFTTGGLVTSVSARVGASVRKGAVLATVDGSALQAQVNAAAAGVTAASALVASQTPSTTGAASAQAQLAAAQAKLVQAQAALAATALSSPIAGTVASVTIAPGDVLGGSNGSTNGTTVSGVSSGANGHAANSSSGAAAQIVVISPSAFLVTADVSGVDLPQVAEGMQAQVTPTGSTHPLAGVVRSVGILADSASGASATFPVVIGLSGSPSGLYAGGSADVSIIVKQLSGVLTVPTQALHTAGSATVVLQLVNGKQVSTPVTVGATFGRRTQILSGLRAGDLVVVPSGSAVGARAGRARSGKGSANRRNGGGAKSRGAKATGGQG